jgi:DNA-binding NarL/FixJ family response regulator
MQMADDEGYAKRRGPRPDPDLIDPKDELTEAEGYTTFSLFDAFVQVQGSGRVDSVKPYDPNTWDGSIANLYSPKEKHQINRMLMMPDRFNGATDKQREVLALRASGMTNSQIALLLGISRQAVGERIRKGEAAIATQM